MASGREMFFAPLPDDAVAIDVRRAPRAKRMTLRIPPGNANPVVTIPAHAPLRSAEQFVNQQSRWLAARLAERCPAVPFDDGAIIPFRGTPHTIRHMGTARRRGAVWLGEDGNALHVGGRPEHLPRRVGDYLRRAAREDLEPLVANFAAAVGRKPKAIRIKDTRAQWGSCSPSGVLSFSWRLVLAPPFVLRYVAAHEVAHLVELNHSAAFWRVNAKLDPNHEAARHWLRRNGRGLHAVGATPSAPD